MPIYAILLSRLWVLCEIKTRTSSCLINLVWKTHSLFLSRVISLILQTREISLHKNNLCVLHRRIRHSLVFKNIENIIESMKNIENILESMKCINLFITSIAVYRVILWVKDVFEKRKKREPSDSICPLKFSKRFYSPPFSTFLAIIVDNSLNCVACFRTVSLWREVVVQPAWCSNVNSAPGTTLLVRIIKTFFKPGIHLTIHA